MSHGRVSTALSMGSIHPCEPTLALLLGYTSVKHMLAMWNFFRKKMKKPENIHKTKQHYFQCIYGACQIYNQFDT